LGKKPEMKILPMKTRDVNLTDEKREVTALQLLVGPSIDRTLLDLWTSQPFS
jgi:hypothetical protein